MKKKQNAVCLVILMIFFASCKKAGPSPEIIEHKCYPTKCIHNLGLYSRDEFRLDSNKNLIEHYHSGYKSEDLRFKYNANQQIIQSIYHLTDLTETIDTTDYLYSNDTLKSTEERRYKQYLANPPSFGNKITKRFDYKLNGNLIIITKYEDDQIQSIQEQNYANDNLISIVSYDQNHSETGRLGFEYNEKENSISFSINEYPVEKIWYDDKNSPVKYLNLFNTKNNRILFDNLLSQVTFTGTSFLLSGHNPIMIVQATDTVKYTYEYNEFDFPTSCNTSDRHNHQFEFVCGDNK